MCFENICIYLKSLHDNPGHQRDPEGSIIKNYAVFKCPAARQGLKWTKRPAVRNFHRISTERFFQISCSVQDDEITELMHTIKSAYA